MHGNRRTFIRQTGLVGLGIAGGTLTPERNRSSCQVSAARPARRHRPGAGHWGTDLFIDWRLVDCLRNGIPLDQDVYDAAALSSIVPLSQWSVLSRSNSIDVPDFTKGAWESNPPNMDIMLERGGSTGVIL